MRIHSRGKSHITKRLVQGALATIGLELRRKPRRSVPSTTPPPIYNDPLEALYLLRDEQKAAFHCPISRLVDLKGFAFSGTSWHPFVSVVEGYNQHGYDYAYALLGKFYSTHRPLNAAEAIPGFAYYPDVFLNVPPHVYPLSPWKAIAPEAMESQAKSWIHRDNTENGREDLFLETHGFTQHGPVHRDKLELELNRLLSLRASIISNGFDRTFGDINVRVVKRNNEFLFVVNGGGYHRAAVMAALGYTTIPAKFYPGPFINDIADVELWPQVRLGVWSADQALAYVDHLFDFDSVAWARERDLLLEQNPRTSEERRQAHKPKQEGNYSTAWKNI